MAMKQRVNKKKAAKSLAVAPKIFYSTNPDKKFELGKSIPPNELLKERRDKEDNSKKLGVSQEILDNISKTISGVPDEKDPKNKEIEVKVQKTAKEIELEELYKYFDSLFDLSEESNEETKNYKEEGGILSDYHKRTKETCIRLKNNNEIESRVKSDKEDNKSDNPETTIGTEVSELESRNVEENYDVQTANSKIINERRFAFNELITSFEKKSNLKNVDGVVTAVMIIERTFSYDNIRSFWGKKMN